MTPVVSDVSIGPNEIGMLILAVLFCLAASAAITAGVFFFVRWWDRRREKLRLARLKKAAEETNSESEFDLGDTP